MPFRDVLPQESEFWEACARHTNRQTARTIQAIYLCDDCAIRLTKEGFNDRPPIYHGETIEGFCGLCNAGKNVTLRFWFACVYCWNVVVAYQKGFVASQSVHDYWARSVTPLFPHLKLTETGKIYISPYARSPRTKKAAATGLKELDFVVANVEGDQETPLFHIELKAGPGSIQEMLEFQLDINDSNDIIGCANNTKLPCYIFQEQLAHRYAPPTRATVAIGTWWTDIFTLLENQVAVRGRRGEEKEAGYYSPRAFKPIETFADELRERRYTRLKERLEKEPLTLT